MMFGIQENRPLGWIIPLKLGGSDSLTQNTTKLMLLITSPVCMLSDEKATVISLAFTVHAVNSTHMHMHSSGIHVIIIHTPCQWYSTHTELCKYHNKYYQIIVHSITFAGCSELTWSFISRGAYQYSNIHICSGIASSPVPIPAFQC